MNTHQFNASDSKQQLRVLPIAFFLTNLNLFFENGHYLKCFDNLWNRINFKIMQKSF